MQWHDLGVKLVLGLLVVIANDSPKLSLYIHLKDVLTRRLYTFMDISHVRIHSGA